MQACISINLPLMYDFSKFCFKFGKVQKQPPGCSEKIGVLKNFVNFTGKHLFRSLFLIKFQAVLKAFSCEIFKNTYFEEHLRTTSKSRHTKKAYRTDFKNDLVTATITIDITR